MTSPLRVVPPGEGSGNPDRGRLITAADVAKMIRRSDAWVRRNVPRKIRLGHSTVRWFEHHVWAWMEECEVDDPRT